MSSRKCSSSRKAERRHRSPTPDDSQNIIYIKDELQTSTTNMRRKITPYKFSKEQTKEIIKYIKGHPELYDRGMETWKNRPHKDTLWAHLAKQFPGCTVDQIKKFYNQSRTSYGKMDNRLLRSGSYVPRTYTEKFILENWSFLKGHVSHHGNTISNDDAAIAESARPACVPSKKKRSSEERLSNNDETASNMSVASNQDMSNSVRCAAADPMDRIQSFLDTCSSRLGAVQQDNEKHPLQRRVDAFYSYFKECYFSVDPDDAFEIEQEVLAVFSRYKKRKAAAASVRVNVPPQPPAAENPYHQSPSNLQLQAVVTDS